MGPGLIRGKTLSENRPKKSSNSTDILGLYTMCILFVLLKAVLVIMIRVTC